MIDPTAPTQLDNPPTWSDIEIADAGFARRCATYLSEQGLEPPAIVLALQAELGLAAAHARTLVDSTRCAESTVSPRRGPFTATQMTPNVQLITI